jgi:type I restriction enzyme S subunit
LGKATAWLGEGEVAVHDDCYIFRHTLNPTFASHLFESSSFRKQKARFAAGTKVSRISGASLAKIEVVIPPLAEQRRIVDVIDAVDKHIAGLNQEAAVAERLARVLAEHLLDGLQREPLGNFLRDIAGGRSPMTTGISPRDGERGVLKVSAVTPFRFIAAESKALLADTLMPESAEVRPGDVLITRANTPDRVGAVCRVPQSVRGGLFLCDKTLRMVPADSIDPDYLVVAMALRSSRAYLSGSATGTSASMSNISQSKIRSTPIPAPSLGVQRSVAQLIGSARSSVDARIREVGRLLTFRSTLLDALLNREVEIPDPYDALSEVRSV